MTRTTPPRKTKTKINPATDPLSWISSLPPTLSRADVARYAGCSERHVDRTIDSGQLLVVRLGRRVRVLRDSFERWLRAGLRQVA